MLRLDAVSGGYGPAPVLAGVSLDVAEGETVALLGPNGAGKSTLMAAITGTLPRRAGRIEYGADKRDLARLSSHAIVAAGVALVPEGRQIFAPLTVADNLRLGAIRLARGASLAERHDAVFRLFPRLQERARQRAGTLSGGEQQMLAIGRALMSRPRLLLLDEPFLGLAPIIVAEIGRALDALKAEGLTILLVDQKIDMALAMSRRAYVMVKGRIVLHEESSRLARRGDLHNLYFALAEEAR
jgi:branched-chain amino acid transport system ATP-binding protein